MMHQFLFYLSLFGFFVALFMNFYDFKLRPTQVLNQVGQFEDLSLSQIKISFDDGDILNNFDQDEFDAQAEARRDHHYQKK